MSMNPEIKAKWLQALRSGGYKQTTGMLQNLHGEFCCLGVLCNLLHPEKWVNSESRFTGVEYAGHGSDYLPDEVAAAANVPASIQGILADMNDQGKKSFAEIADYIEANL